MKRLTLALSFALSFMSASAFAQQCLHGTGETAEQTARRRDALTATRTINNLQFNQPAARDCDDLRDGCRDLWPRRLPAILFRHGCC